MALRDRSTNDNRRRGPNALRRRRPRPHGSLGHDIVRRDTETVQETPGASIESKFIRSPLPPIPSEPDAFYGPCPQHTRKRVRVLNGDTFDITRQLVHDNLDARGNTAVLNLASGRSPAGGWNGFSTSSQEEALCYSSTLFATLKPEYYPWAPLGMESVVGIYSPNVAITRSGLNGPVSRRQIVSVISVAAQRNPLLNNANGPTRLRTFRHETDLIVLREKIRLIYRLAAKNGKTFLVLGALGCGAFKCPPLVVAREMKAILEEREFDGWFKEVCFAIFGQEPRQGQRLDTGYENFIMFREVFEGR